MGTGDDSVDFHNKYIDNKLLIQLSRYEVFDLLLFCKLRNRIVILYPLNKIKADLLGFLRRGMMYFLGYLKHGVTQKSLFDPYQRY